MSETKLPRCAAGSTAIKRTLWRARAQRVQARGFGEQAAPPRRVTSTPKYFSPKTKRKLPNNGPAQAAAFTVELQQVFRKFNSAPKKASTMREAKMPASKSSKEPLERSLSSTKLAVCNDGQACANDQCQNQQVRLQRWTLRGHPWGIPRKGPPAKT